MNRHTFRSRPSAVAPLAGSGSGFPIGARLRRGLFKELSRAMWPASRDGKAESRVRSPQSNLTLSHPASSLPPLPGSHAAGRVPPPARTSTHDGLMREIKDRVATLVLGASSLALALAPIILLFWLMQPKVLANPGIGALRVAGAASYEPFLHDAEPAQLAEPPRRESAARLAPHDPQYREAATSKRKSEREPSRPARPRATKRDKQSHT